jgi:predicted nucleic acid-binding protein
MTDSTFLDTNVFVYAFDQADAAKQQRAQKVLATTPGIVVSPQVMNEFYVVTTRKLATPLPAAQAASVVRSMGQLDCVPIDTDLVDSALRIGPRCQLSHWDALMVAAALRRNCRRLLTEDLADGSTIDGVLIENPFT